jgi:hypothetical protein
MSRLKFRSLFPTGSLNISGSVTASFFVGDGSGLTNLPLSDVSALNAFTSSANSRLDDLEAATASYLQAADLSELNIFTGSTDSRLDSIEAATSSYLQAADLSDLNIFTGSASSRLDSIEAATSSYATIAELNSSSSILQSNLDTVSSSLAAETAQLLDFSASLDNTFATDVELNTVSASLKTFATDADTTLSASLAIDIDTNRADINNASSSLALRIANQETFSSSLDNTFATDAELNTVSASVKVFATDADTVLSSSLAVDIAINKEDLSVASSSLATRITNQELFSASLDDTFATDLELNTVSASLKTFATDADTALSASLAVDITTNASDIISVSSSAASDIATNVVNIGSNTTKITSLEAVTGSYATTGPNQFVGDQNITGDLTVTGTITAQEFHSEFISSSIIYESGSTKFGDTADDNHDFTGSLRVSGSITAIDISIDDWGSVSGSLVEISASAAAANSITLQGVTDNGSLTTNHISISSSLNVSQSIISKGEDVLDFAVAMAIALG